MKRLMLSWLLFSLVASSAGAQSTTNPDAQRPVVLRGTGGSGSVIPSSLDAPANAVPPQASLETELAKCSNCNQEVTECYCPSGCGLTVFAEWMYLQPRGADAVYAARALNCFDPPLDAHQIDFGGFDSYRFGFWKTVHDGCSEIGASFWTLEAQEEDRAPRTIGQDVILPLLLHPNQIDCPGTTSTFARASAGIDFDRVNIDYKQYFTWACTQFDCLVGFGYGKLEQDLAVSYDENRMRADSDLHGYGLRLGAGAAKTHRWISGYLHGDFTLLAANLNARYRSFDTFDGKEVDYDQNLDRLVPILDLEAGVAFNVSCHTTIKVGYIYSIWWNVVTNPSFIEEVQQGDVSGGVGDSLTFDGVFARVEFTF